MAVAPCIEELCPDLSGKTALYSVVKNDYIFLTSWIEHYRIIGVERFIIVDDGSDRPLVDAMLGDDVFIFKPVVGDFKNFKVFWLMCLMKRFQRAGSVCVCADADEYIDMPESDSDKV